MQPTQRALALLLLSCSACGAQSDEPSIRVRAAQIEGGFQYFEVVIDGHEREIFVDEGQEGDHVAVIVDEARHGVVVFASAECDADELTCTLAEGAFAGELAQLADEQLETTMRLRFLGCDIDYDGTGNYICMSCSGPFSTRVDCFPA